MAETGMVRIGLIGTGVALRTHLPGFRRTGRAEVVALAGSSPERARHFAAQHGIPRAYADHRALCADPDIDLVVVASPNDAHFAHVQEALLNGKHVLAEKPLAMTMAETRELVDLAARANRLAFINHQLRFNPHLQAVGRLIRGGDLGRLYYIRFHYQIGQLDPHAAFTWHTDESRGGGVRLAMASHLTDLLWFWLGEARVFNVHGRLDALVPQRRDAAGVLRQVHTAGFYTAHLSLADNLEVHMADTPGIGGNAFRIDVYGTRGELHYDASEGLLAAFSGGGGLQQPVAIDPQAFDGARPDGSVFRRSFDLFARELVDAVASGDPAQAAAAAVFADALPTQAVLEAIRDSAISGQVVQLAEGYTPGARY